MPYTPNDEQNMQAQFAQLYQEKYDELIRCAHSIFRNYQQGAQDSQIEEVVQETFMTAWKRRGDLFSKTNPGGWLYEILRIKIKEWIREQLRWKRAMQAYEAHYSEPFLKDALIKLDIESFLTKEEYQLFCWIYREGCSYLEICEKLHISKSALASRVSRIKKKLRNFL